MFRKLNNKNLIIIFFILLIVVAAILLFDSGKNERTFREVLVDIDTSAVTEIHIISKANNFKTVRLFKDDGGWFVELPSGKSVSVADQRISQTFKELTAVVPKRLAARGKDKWSEFQVDSSGTRVQVIEGGSTTLDLIIGRFNYQQQPRSISTYVRLANDNDVYEVDGFLSMTFNQTANAFRNGTIVKADYNNWNQLVFDYPDSSFTLKKIGDRWFIDQIQTDSAKTVTYLRTLSNMTRNNFIDTVEIAKDKNPDFKLNISTANLDFTEVDAYIEPSTIIVTTSQNPDTKFDGKTFFKNIFVSKKSFFK